MGIPPSADALGQTGPRPTAPPPIATDENVEQKTEGETEKANDDGNDEPNEPRREIKLNARQKLERAIRDDPSEATATATTMF